MNIELEIFLRDGTFGLIEFGMTREEIQSLIGTPDGIFQRRKDSHPTAFEYGDVEFYFLSSADNRLCCIYLDAFDVPKGNQTLELDSWFLEGGQSKESVEAMLIERKINFRPVEQTHLIGEEIITEGGVVLGFELTEDNDSKLHSIGLSRRDEMEVREPSKQISITIPMREYEKIRREAERRRQKMSKICSHWIVERASELE